MITSDFFIQIVLILISARFLGELASKFSIPSVIGELLAGIILGPSLLNWLQPTETIHLLAEIGIVLLLFEVGIEADISKLAKNGLKASASAFAGIIFPLVLGFLVSYYLFHLGTLLSLFVGSTLTATSIGVTLRVLSDLNRKKSHESQIVLGAAILDDIIGIVLLSILYEFSAENSVNYFTAGKVLLFIVAFLITAPFLVKIISNVIKRYEKISSIPGLLTTSTIALLLFFAWLARKFGAPELIGGFAAGLALSRNFFLPLPSYLQTDENFSYRVERNMKPLIHLFVPIFFVNIGLSLNFQQIAWNSSFIWAFSGIILLIAIIGKLTSGFILFKESKWIKWIVGIAMIPRGEVGLIFAEVGRVSNIFNQEIYASMILVIAITTLISPIVLRGIYQKAPSSRPTET